MSQLGRYLFVYGTLRPSSGHPMAGFLAERARHAGDASTAGRLYRLAWYPGLMSAAAPGDAVRGDLYELLDPETTLTDLDRYETDASARFERREVMVVDASGEKRLAWVYFYKGEVKEEWRILSGDYLQ